MTAKIFFVFSALFGSTVLPAYAKPDRRLENLAVDVKTLPAACKATDPRKDPANAELTKQNPAVTADPKFIHDMSMLLFGESFNYDSIDQATFLTYLGGGIEGNEIGIFAWLFKTNEDAEKARQALFQSGFVDEEAKKMSHRKTICWFICGLTIRMPAAPVSMLLNPMSNR